MQTPEIVSKLQGMPVNDKNIHPAAKVDNKEDEKSPHFKMQNTFRSSSNTLFKSPKSGDGRDKIQKPLLLTDNLNISSQAQ